MSLKKRAAKATMWSMVESLGVRVVMFASGIVLARLLEPEDFGLTAMIYVFIELSHSLANGGFQVALVQKKDLSELDINSVFYFNVGIGAALSFVLYFSAGAISAFFGQSQLVDIVQIMSIIPVLNSLNIVQHSMAAKELNMKKLARSTVVSSLVSVSVCIFMAFDGYGVWALVAQQIVAVVVLFFGLWFRSDWYPKAQFSFGSIKQMFDFSSKVLVADFIGQLFKNIYYVVIGKLFSAELLGFYSRADNLRKFVSDTLSRTIERVSFPVFSQVQDDLGRVKRIMQKSTRVSSFVAFPAMVGLAAIAEELIPFLLTDKWNPSIPFFQLLCVVGMFSPMYVISRSGYKALGLAGLVLKLTILKNALVVVGILATYQFGLMAIIVGQVIVSFFIYLIDVHYNKKYFGYPIKEQVKDIFPFLFSSSVMALFITLVGSQLSLSIFLIMLIKVAVGGCIYLGCLWLLRNSTLQDSVSLLREAIKR